MYQILAGIASAALVVTITGCCCGSGSSFNEYMEQAQEASSTTTEEEVVASEPRDVGGGGGEVGGGGPCARYARCCKDYADSLKTIPGYPEDAVQAQKDSCDQVKQLSELPGGDDACRTSLEALQQGMDATSSWEGWKKPESCK